MAGDRSAGGDGLCLILSAGDGERRGLSDFPGGDILERLSAGDVFFFTGTSSSDEDESLLFGCDTFFLLDGGLTLGLFLSLAATDEEFLGCKVDFSLGEIASFFRAGDRLSSSDEDDPSLDDEDDLLFTAGTLTSRSGGDGERFPLVLRVLASGLGEFAGLL